MTVNRNDNNNNNKNIYILKSSGAGGCALQFAHSGWRSKRRSGAAVELVTELRENLSPLTKACGRASPNFLFCLFYAFKTFASVLLSMRPSAAHHSLWRSLMIQEGVCFSDCDSIAQKARLWLYEFAWISCCSSRAFGTVLPLTFNPLGGILWIFTHGSYIFFNISSCCQIVIPLMQLCALRKSSFLSSSLFRSTYSPPCFFSIS